MAVKKTPVKPQYKSFKKRKAPKVPPTINIAAHTPEQQSTDLTKPRKSPAAHLAPFAFQAGNVANPLGRPKGSRNRFAEAFVADFLSDWEEHGAKALADCRACDPAAYLKVAATLLPKDLNINHNDGAALDRLLDQFNDQQLSQLIGALASVGAAQALRAKTIEGEAAKEPD